MATERCTCRSGSSLSRSRSASTGAGQPPLERLALFERAFNQGVCLAFTYRGRHGTESSRCIEPHGLLVEPPVWYVLAHDVDEQAARTFQPGADIIRSQTLHLE